MRAMISVREAQARILAQVDRVAPPEVIPLGSALGRVLADDVRAVFDVPPTDNSAVDGYAMSSADIPASGTRELRGGGRRSLPRTRPRLCLRS